MAHNLCSAMLDNHLHRGNNLDLDLNRILWPRVIDMNDRSLREEQSDLEVRPMESSEQRGLILPQRVK